MPVRHLTDRGVQALKADPRGQIDYWDDSLPGFCVRVAPSGRKTWTVYYRYHRRKRRLTLGTYPTVRLAEARKRANEAISKIQADTDPVAERLRALNAGTFDQLSKEFLERHSKPRKKSWRNDQWIINSILVPKWKHIKAEDIKRADVRVLLESIVDRGSGVLANRVLALVRKMFNFAIERDWLENNPCRAVQRLFVESGRDRVLSADEIVKLWEALDKEDPFFQALFKLRFFTAARGGEIRHMRWADVDLEAGWWNLPAEFAKNSRAHRLPLVDEACELLRALQDWQQHRLREVNKGRMKKKLDPRKPSEWVFPSPRGDEDPFDWEQRATKRIRERCDIDFRPHDIRRTVSTYLRDHSIVDREGLKMILNHVDRDITARYDRSKQDALKRTALESWARQLRSVLNGEDNRAKVVPISSSSQR